MGFSGFYLVLNRFYCFFWFYLGLLGFSGFRQVLLGLEWILRCFVEFD